MVTCFDVCEILEMLSEASVKVFLDGGWGVDALIGRETRIHNDIDLFVEKKDYCITISVITGKGYREVITVSYTHLTLPTMMATCRSRWSPYH